MKFILKFWPVFLFFALAVISIFLFPPFFGFMDDLNYLNTAQRILDHGIVQHYRDWLLADLNLSGRIRPLLPIMVSVVYLPFKDSFLFLHLWNFVLAFFSLIFLTYSLSKLWVRIFQWNRLSQDRVFLIVFCLTLALPWTRHLFTLPALQEKTVFFLAAFAILFPLTGFYSNLGLISRLLFMVPILVIGSFSREQFVLFYPIILSSVWVSIREKPGDRRIMEIAFSFLLMLGIVFVIWKLGQGNAYKNKYSIAVLEHTFRNSKSIWLYLALGFLSLAVTAYRLKGSSNFGGAPFAFFAPLSLLGFVALMAPWGVGGYLNTISTPLVSITLLSVFPAWALQCLEEKWLGRLFFSCGVMCGVGFLLLDVTTKNDLLRILDSKELRELGARSIEINAPCEEGGEHLKSYPKIYFGYSLVVNNSPQPLSAFKAGQGSYWFVGRNLSCWPGDFDPGALVSQGRAEIVWAGHHPWSHRLLYIKP